MASLKIGTCSILKSFGQLYNVNVVVRMTVRLQFCPAFFTFFKKIVYISFSGFYQIKLNDLLNKN